MEDFIPFKFVFVTLFFFEPNCEHLNKEKETEMIFIFIIKLIYCFLLMLFYFYTLSF